MAHEKQEKTKAKWTMTEDHYSVGTGIIIKNEEYSAGKLYSIIITCAKTELFLSLHFLPFSSEFSTERAPREALDRANVYSTTISSRFGVKSDFHIGAKEATFKFTPSELEQLEGILKFISQRFELIEPSVLTTLSNKMRDYFDLPVPVENPAVTFIRQSVASLSSAAQADIPEKDQAIIKEILSMIIKSGKDKFDGSLWLFAVNLMHQADKIGAAIFLLTEMHHQDKLTPKGHAKISSLLCTSTRAPIQIPETMKVVISHALQGLSLIAHDDENEHVQEAEATLQNALALIMGNPADGLKLKQDLQCYIDIFKGKLFDVDVYAEDKFYKMSVKRAYKTTFLSTDDTAKLLIDFALVKKRELLLQRNARAEELASSPMFFAPTI
jgi:hypothetical protein